MIPLPTRWRRILTTHMNHCNLELLPIPLVLASVHLLHHEFHILQPPLRFPLQIVLSHVVPDCFWDATGFASLLDLDEPVVNS